MKRILISGATGFVGAFLARYFAEAGHDVHLLVRAADVSWRLATMRDRFTPHIASLFDPAELDALFARTSPDWVFHLAAYGAYSSQRDDARILQTNLLGTMNFLDAARRKGVEAFVNTGSSSEYGFCETPPTEVALPRPNSMYAYSKAAASLYAAYLAELHGMPVSTVRLYSVYGPYEEPTRFIPRLLIRAIDGGFPPLVEPSVARDFVYVGDVARAYDAIARSQTRSPIYNVGSGVQTTIGEAVDVVRAQLGLTGLPVWGSMGNRSWDTGSWVANVDRIAATIGWEPQVDFKTGCRKTVDWLLSDPGITSFYRADHALPT